MLLTLVHAAAAGFFPGQALLRAGRRNWLVRHPACQARRKSMHTVKRLQTTFWLAISKSGCLQIILTDKAAVLPLLQSNTALNDLPERYL